MEETKERYQRWKQHGLLIFRHRTVVGIILNQRPGIFETNDWYFVSTHVIDGEEGTCGGFQSDVILCVGISLTAQTDRTNLQIFEVLEFNSRLPHVE